MPQRLQNSTWMHSEFSGRAPRVLHVINSISTGGAEHALSNLLVGGLSDSFESAVLSLKVIDVAKAQVRFPNVPLYSLDLAGTSASLGSLFKLNTIIQSFQPDIVQGWMYHGNLAASLAARLSNHSPRVVWNIRHSLYDLNEEKIATQRTIRIGRWLSGTPSTIIYNSEISREQHERFGFSRSRSVLIPNGFASALGSVDKRKRAAVRASLGIGDERIVIGHVARCHPMKDHRGFLVAAAEVAKVVPNVCFVMAGREVDTRMRPMLHLMPEELRSRFYLLGERSDVPSLMGSFDVFCTSSAWGEAFPNVIGEAMMSGLPCVVTDVGDSARIVGDTGFVVPPSNAVQLTNALIQVLSLSIKQRQDLGHAARRRVLQCYSIENAVEAYKLLYRQNRQVAANA